MKEVVNADFNTLGFGKLQFPYLFTKRFTKFVGYKEVCPVFLTTGQLKYVGKNLLLQIRSIHSIR